MPLTEMHKSATAWLRPYSSDSDDERDGDALLRTAHEIAQPASMKSHPETVLDTPWSASTGKCGSPVRSGSFSPSKGVNAIDIGELLVEVRWYVRHNAAVRAKWPIARRARRKCGGPGRETDER